VKPPPVTSLPAQQAVTTPAPPAALPKPAAPVYEGPSSGRIIWIGSLPKNSTLTIEGRRATAGSVNSQLPGVPVRIGAYPAEMTGGGFVVYSSSPKHARAAVEPPSALNGWNRTQFRGNARRAGDVVVVEPPGPQNNWHRVVVRTGGNAVTAIIFEWEVAQ
jgi:hypothetical protein